MFTGIIETTGEIRSRRTGWLGVRPRRPLRGIAAGESIAVDGVCLTVDQVKNEGILFRLLPETLRATTLGSLKPGGRVNLERSLQAGSRIGGHLLLGHVDGRGRIVSRRRAGDTLTLGISLPAAFARLLVPKGPVAVDGISLTVGTVETDCFYVHLVSHTLSATALSGKGKREEVNLEIDLIVKYLRGML